MIAIVDYGAGNLRSVCNALKALDCGHTVTGNPDDLKGAAAVIFPGVGAAAEAMGELKRLGLDRAISDCVRRGTPLFAICIGMQLLFTSTEEDGGGECLGILPGRVRRLPAGLKVPHMGWNQVKQMAKHPVFDGIPDDENFYFVHSYYAAPEDPSVVAGVTEYGVPLCSMVIQGSIIATQFHPEKSGEVGLRMYQNFVNMVGRER